MAKNWKCAHCGYINLAASEACGQNESYEGRDYGCGKLKRMADETFGNVIVGALRGIPVYDSDLRHDPELSQHEDFISVSGHEELLLALRAHDGAITTAHFADDAIDRAGSAIIS